MPFEVWFQGLTEQVNIIHLEIEIDAATYETRELPFPEGFDLVKCLINSCCHFLVTLVFHTSEQ